MQSSVDHSKYVWWWRTLFSPLKRAGTSIQRSSSVLATLLNTSASQYRLEQLKPIWARYVNYTHLIKLHQLFLLFLVRRGKTQRRIIRVFLQLTDGLGNRAVEELYIDIEILVRNWWKSAFTSYASIYVIFFLMNTIANGDFKYCSK